MWRALASTVKQQDCRRRKDGPSTNRATTIFVGRYYEKVNGTVVKYYYAGDRRVAMRTGGQTYYLFPDHLGSTHVTANSSGVMTGRLLYRPWGETRDTYLTTLTTWRFTGQREDATIGLYFYNARFYDPVLGRFTQPDSIVPDPRDPQSLNRYSYAQNNAVKYTDPTGHCIPELCPGVPDAAPPGNPEGLRGEAYAQWLYNLILWIDRERAATGGVYNVTSNLIQEAAAHELNSFLMDDPEILGDQFYQELLMATPQLSAAAAGAGASVLMSSGGRVLGAVRNAASEIRAIVPYYPPNDGFSGEPRRITLEPGFVIDRYGAPSGRYASPQGTPPWARSLPPGAESKPLNAYEVLKPLEVDAGPAAPWFGQPGGGDQYYLVQKQGTLSVLLPHCVQGRLCGAPEHPWLIWLRTELLQTVLIQNDTEWVICNCTRAKCCKTYRTRLSETDTIGMW